MFSFDSYSYSYSSLLFFLLLSSSLLFILASYDQHHWTNQSQWYVNYVSGAQITSITPQSGPPNATLTITGFGFRNNSKVYCLFGPVSDFIMTNANVSGPTQVNCNVNASLAYGFYPVTLVVDGALATSNYYFNVTGGNLSRVRLLIITAKRDLPISINSSPFS